MTKAELEKLNGAIGEWERRTGAHRIDYAALIASDPSLARQLADVKLSGQDKTSYPTVARAAKIARRTEELASEEVFGAVFDNDLGAHERGDTAKKRRGTDRSQERPVRMYKLLQSQGRPTSRRTARKMMPEITNEYQIVVRSLKNAKKLSPKSAATIRAETKVSAPQLKSILKSLQEKRLIKYRSPGRGVYFAPHR